MKIIQFILIESLIVMSSVAFSQPLVLTDRDVDYVSITAINKQNSVIESRVKSNIKINIPTGSGSDINDSGLIIVFDKLIQNSTGNPQVIELPKPKKEIVAPQFSTSDNILFFWDADDAYTNTIHRYDLMKNAITYSQIFNTTRTFDEAFGHRILSRDGLTLAMEMGSYLKIFEYIDNIFVKSAEIGQRPAFPNLLISKYGNRVFYKAKDESQEWEIVYVEKSEKGWSKENNLSTPYINIDGGKMPLQLVDIANDGKTILTKTAVWPLQKQYIALIHEKEGKWMEPEFVGEYTLPPTDGPVYSADIYISEDGRVIAMRQPRELSSAIIPGDLVVVSHDVFVFVQDNAGRWHKHQVNPPDVGADGFNDILLSPNGEQLYWVPEKTLSEIPWGNQIK